MNKKGFTLVELISVLVILSLVITIVATKGFGAFNNAKDAISEQNLKTIKDAVNFLKVEVENCNDDLEDYEGLKKYFNIEDPNSVISCDSLKQEIIKNGTVNLNNMADDGYFKKSILEDLSEETIKFIFCSSTTEEGIFEVKDAKNNATCETSSE